MKFNYNFNDDKWKINYKKVQAQYHRTLDFTSIKEPVKSDVKHYAQHLLLETEYKLIEIQRKVIDIRGTMEHFYSLPYEEIHSILDFNYQHVLHIINYMQTIGRSYNFIRSKITAMRLFFDYYNEKSNSSLPNPFRRYMFRNVKSFSNRKTEYIPTEIVDKLSVYLHEASAHVINTWTILINTGMRYSDVQMLEDDCLYFNKEINMNVLKYKIVKTVQQRINAGDGSYHHVPVNNSVVEAINKQKELTLDLRLLSNTKYIFLRSKYKSNTIYLLNPVSVQDEINSIIKKHNILGHDGQLFHYKHHMCRKTVVMEMITNGASIREVADYIGHSERVSEQYYRDMDMKKIAELDNEMWGKLIDQTIDEDVKEQYTFEERESMIREIKLGARDTPEGHGHCIKHVSFGTCKKRTCVGCRMLITAPQKLPKWYKLYSEQSNYMEELEQTYQQNNVEDYKKHRIYQQELRLLDIYKDTISKVEKFAKKEGINIEEFKQIKSDNLD